MIITSPYQVVFADFSTERRPQRFDAASIDHLTELIFDHVRPWFGDADVNVILNVVTRRGAVYLGPDGSRKGGTFTFFEVVSAGAPRKIGGCAPRVEGGNIGLVRQSTPPEET